MAPLVKRATIYHDQIMCESVSAPCMRSLHWTWSIRWATKSANRLLDAEHLNVSGGFCLVPKRPRSILGSLFLPWSSRNTSGIHTETCGIHPHLPILVRAFSRTRHVRPLLGVDAISSNLANLSDVNPESTSPSQLETVPSAPTGAFASQRALDPEPAPELWNGSGDFETWNSC